MLKEILKLTLIKNISDLHLVVGISPRIRLRGEILETDLDIINREKMEIILRELLSEEDIFKFKKKKILDISKKFQEKILRIHIYQERSNPALAIRIIPEKIPTIEELNLPPIVKDISKIKNGLVLVTGITGSGKSTTLASIIDYINQRQTKHIITVEEPIEYIHQHKKSMVNQREIGEDIPSYKEALSSLLREDPDIIVLGELRDLETISSALTLAETGHLVLSTLHTRSAASTIARIIDVFPKEKVNQIRSQLSNSLEMIVSQELIRSREDRLPLCEIMIMNNAIRNLIRENGQLSSINDQIHTNHKSLGSQSFEQSLNYLKNLGRLD